MFWGGKEIIMGPIIAWLFIMANVAWVVWMSCYHKPTNYKDCYSPEDEEAVTKSLDGWMKSGHPELRNDK
jgi:hypothetical protein